ncbi:MULTISPECIES: ParB family protein [Pasteurellaceae]|uniref:ParB/Sulfiredoxin domain-containing protein n=1 Tax=Pasteurella atlantica TaxID=2827233 RepID=A0AAW8CQ64_9PAST|nr:ParB family protein [Pasteurella atlantica]MBR0573819.1 hypothetical protein [Pasteurella atlantica]MDP8039755.1 hypothetical protein [Pasteurella atlantica]MDP8041940.1 hypothetical protein [Pasteurella atlantica]MDP8044035.1 hypothetical protein [Pasteurella atlantica]MDP8046013.1 hypothetical protein [Pasteurella atlantica]
MSKGFLNFHKNTASLSTDEIKSTPIDGQVFTLDILNISPSRLNPRQTLGVNYQEHYENLKESIRNIGLQSILTVTKYPNSNKYELYNGGNTRLKILIELYQEYQQKGELGKANTYRYQSVKFVEFTDELDVLVKHMAENEERINMTFIDKARAIFQIKELYLQQHNNEDISNRQLADFISQLGWSSVKHQVMTELSFAFEKLDLVIPLALNNGMGRPKVKQLRQWLNHINRYIQWLKSNKGYNINYDEVEILYFQVLKQFDDDIEPINLDSFYQLFLFQLSDYLAKFDTTIKVESITFAISNLSEFGYIPDSSALPQENNSIIFDTDNNILTEQDTSDDSDDPIKAENVNIDNKNSHQKRPNLWQEALLLCDTEEKLQEMLCSSEEHQYFSYFDVSTDNGYKTIVQVMQGNNIPLQYFVLHCLAIVITYGKGHFLSLDKIIYNQTYKLWEKYGERYGRYYFDFHLNPPTEQASYKVMQQVHSLCIDMLNNIRGHHNAC